MKLNKTIKKFIEEVTVDYYKIKPEWKNIQDVTEAKNLNFAQGNILKAAWCLGERRHIGTNYDRELDKIIWFAFREKERIKIGADTPAVSNWKEQCYITREELCNKIKGLNLDIPKEGGFIPTRSMCTADPKYKTDNKKDD
jgi:hypothetical protein